MLKSHNNLYFLLLNLSFHHLVLTIYSTILIGDPNVITNILPWKIIISYLITTWHIKLCYTTFHVTGFFNSSNDDIYYDISYIANFHRRHSCLCSPVGTFFLFKQKLFRSTACLHFTQLYTTIISRRIARYCYNSTGRCNAFTTLTRNFETYLTLFWEEISKTAQQQTFRRPNTVANARKMRQFTKENSDESSCLTLFLQITIIYSRYSRPVDQLSASAHKILVYTKSTPE